MTGSDLSWQKALLVTMGVAAGLGAALGLELLRSRRRRKHKALWKYLTDAGRACKTGCVYLVGAGPASADLMTLRAAHLLATATVVVTDDLVERDVLSFAPEGCEIVHVGKRGGRDDSTPQSDIDQLLVEKAREGHAVVRLKGGDPLVFGRVWSEIVSLRDANIPFEIVPGVSSVLSAPAAAVLPLTHKTKSKVVAVASGHEVQSLDWTALANGVIDTYVILMAGKTLPNICSFLLTNGRSEDTPVAVIHNAHREGQRRVVGTIKTIGGLTQTMKLSPAIVVIGDVAALGTYDHLM